VSDVRQRVLVIGASGQVGRQLVAQLALRPEALDVVTASRSDPDPARRFELAQPETVERLLLGTDPQYAILAAAATGVAWCEAHPDESYEINVLGTLAAAHAAQRVGATFTFVSTDYVFDGLRGPYGEGDPTSPMNIYGKHKLEAEAAVVGVNQSNLIVRTCQVFGEDRRRVNFVVRTVDALRSGGVVEVADDLFGTPTFAPDLVRALIELTLRRARGIWHVAGDTFLSRYELAERAAQAFGCTTGTIVKVTADRIHDSVNRPRRAGLRNDRLAAAGFDWITPLDAALSALARKEMSQ
jgi:dTDP-4-dehydrorhamnose reductase